MAPKLTPNLTPNSSLKKTPEQTQKRSNELKIVRGRLLSSKNGSNEQIMNIHLYSIFRKSYIH
jgi:hypothetical protein